EQQTMMKERESTAQHAYSNRSVQADGFYRYSNSTAESARIELLLSSVMRGLVPIGAKLRSSLPGLTRQSIDLRKNFLAKKMDARVKPAHDAHGACPAHPRLVRQRGRGWLGQVTCSGARRGEACLASMNFRFGDASRRMKFRTRPP